MKKIFLTAILISMIAASPSHACDISVLLKHRVQRCSAGGTGLVLTDASGIYTKPFSGNFSMYYSNGAMKAGKVVYKLPVVITGQSLLTIDGVRYKGTIIIAAASGGLDIVNKVDVEDYLKGVLKSEMGPSWPLEALKAQAVLARTYALSSKKHGVYDVCDGTHCQAYDGASVESPVITRAVSETAGEILTYSGTPAQIFYFSDSGGMTTSSQAVWGGAIPYLSAKADPVSGTGSPYRTWTASISMKQIENRLAASGVSVGNLSSIRPYERDESGRVKRLEITGSKGKKIITGNSFRHAVGTDVIKSTLFEFNSQSPYSPQATVKPKSIATSGKKAPTHTSDTGTKAAENLSLLDSDLEKLYWMARNKIFTVDELISMIGKDSEYPKFVAEGLARIQKGKRLQQNQKSAKSPRKGQQEELAKIVQPQVPKLSMEAAASAAVKIYGRGSGHGVGFPQWTAKALAEAGWSYRDMLEYYFSGTALTKR